MTSHENEHDWFSQQIAAYLTGGLAHEEREQFEQHAAACPSCAAELEEMRAMETTLSDLLSPAIPTPDFEDRLLQRLRMNVGSRQWVNPKVRKAAVAAAAVLLLGGFGYVAQDYVKSGVSLKLPNLNRPPLQIAKLTERLGILSNSNTPAPTTASADRGQNEHAQQRDYIDYTFNSAITNVKQAVDGDNPDRAQAQIELARVAANSAPSIFTDEENQSRKAQIELAQQSVDNLRVKQLASSDANTRATAALAVRGQDQGQRVERERTIQDLVREARRMTSDGEYPEALGVTDQILKLDPKNDYALGARPLIVDRARVASQRSASEQRARNVVRQYNAADESLDSFSDVLKYPDDSLTKGLTLDAPASADIKHFMPADASNFNRAGNGDAVTVAGNSYMGGTVINGGALTVSAGRVQTDEKSGTPALNGDSVTTFGNKSTLERFDQRGAAANGSDFGRSVRDRTVVISGDGSNREQINNLIAQLDPSSPAPPATQPINAATAVGPVQAPVASAPATAPGALVIRKVIREGTMEFEVDNFDSTFNQITRITAEEGGFVAAADSDKLNNGKVKGTITVRVPPDRLDTLVLKLRALGDLKSQKLGSKDISKQYTDLQSELRAAKAMETRLLELIAKGTGEVKDLLAAEKELGNWRTKIETIQGEINYYNNLVSMATLTVTAYEKDIRTPASADQTEEINAGIETDDVEAARNSAITAVNEAKGRIVESTLQKLEAGQYTAKIVAEVAPENAGPLLDRLRQLGRVARLDIARKQTPSRPGNTTAPNVQIAKVEQQPTRIIVSMYNLANVAPRLTTNLNLAADDVETVYRAILARIGEADGRVVSSSLNRQDALNAVGNINFEVKSSVADAVANDIRAGASRQVLRLSVTENPDTANVTTAKQAFTVQIIPASQVPPRETRSLTVETSDVESAVQNLGNAVGTAGGRVVESSLSQDQSGKSVAHVSIEVPLDKIDGVVDTARRQGKVRTAESTKNAQVPDGPLARARLNLTIGTGDTIVPAEAGLWHSLREGLSTSVQGLLWSLQLIVIGLCLVAPWILVIWVGWRFARRRKSASAPAA
jgi:glycine cleavage system regulatory protein